MKKIILLAAVCLLSFTISSVSDIKPLYQLTGGVWKMKTAKGYICESWKKASNNELIGKSYKVTGKDTSVTELVQLTKKGNEIYYSPTVTGENNGKSIPFKLIRASNNTYLFSNPEHDYPQIVAYQLLLKIR